MLNLAQTLVRHLLAPLNRFLTAGFHPGSLNPLNHLGSLTIFLFWIVLVSGIWLFIFFRTSVEGAYQSVEYLTHNQWYLGGVMRSLHRYASDAAVITLVLHIAREFALDRYRGKRWFSWLTGVPLLWLVIPLGITGYWLVWDQLALYVAITSAELLDWIPIFTDSMARNFLSSESLSDRFFTLMAFLHLIGLPLFLVLGIWIHVLRISGPQVNPPRLLMAGTLLAMLLLSLVYPALSQGEADPARVPQTLGLDWFYLLIYPLMKTWSPGWVWGLLVGTSLLLAIAPWLPPQRPRRVAVVDLENCNGCERCVMDCPYGAIDMQPRSDGKSYLSEAVVNPDLCVACGICVGACPTATPFRTRSDLIPGIDLPDLGMADLREQIVTSTTPLEGNQRLLVFACDGSEDLSDVTDESTTVLKLACMAQLPPSYLDFVLSRDLADGVVMAGCAECDCRYRFGADWTEQRLARDRDPRLRKRVDKRRIAMAWLDPWDSYRSPSTLLAAFRNSLARTSREKPETSSRPGVAKSYVVQAIAFGLFAALTGILSVWPGFQVFEPDEAVISLTFTHAGQRVNECRRLTQDELNQLAPNMRKPTDCPRERHPVDVLFTVDGTTAWEARLLPSGLWSDGESTAYQRITLESGEYDLFIGMRDSGREEGFDFEHRRRLVVEPGQHVVAEFDSGQQAFIFRQDPP